ncbi:hypothetical protein Kisp01_65910 [Kineosporia sp. NBRC 101677]|nr:hypothetical protein Kisp01_65910 [Kineosporia sp. NBRC 101677]
MDAGAPVCFGCFLLRSDAERGGDREGKAGDEENKDAPGSHNQSEHSTAGRALHVAVARLGVAMMKHERLLRGEVLGALSPHPDHR